MMILDSGLLFLGHPVYTAECDPNITQLIQFPVPVRHTF